MAAELFFGGVAKVEVEDIGGDFTTPLLTIDRFTKGKQNWPNPEPMTQELSDDQAGPTGQKVPFDFAGVNLDGALVDTVRAKAFALTEVLVRFTSKDNARYLQLQCLLLTEPSPIANLGEYGVVKFAGIATSAGAAKAYTLGVPS